MEDFINFLRVIPPHQQQPVAPLPVAKSALLVAINGFVSPSYLRRCLSCDGGGRHCLRVDADVEQMCYQMASFATAVLGVALLAFHMASSSAVFPALAVWLVWLTKIFTCGTLQFCLNIIHFCLRMIYFQVYTQTWIQ
uniref:Uncharacterized protein n=1 Tax=Leersia perrieri TaxID=77586 RepID=A0A0D9X8L1_9ORYZ